MTVTTTENTTDSQIQRTSGHQWGEGGGGGKRSKL